jgi:histone deacetylase 11
MIPIVYCSKYNITAFGLERLHPFDSIKYGRIAKWFVYQGLRKPKDFKVPRPVRRADLLRVHAASYLKSLRRRQVLAGILEVPEVGRLPGWFTDWRVLRPMRWATGGTMLACRLALERGIAITLGGGYHHAGPERGGGFCVYADVPLAITTLQAEGRIRSALVVDTDAHQGNGTADCIRAWPWAHILDFYEEDIYPWPKAREEMAVPLPPLTNDEEYINQLQDQLPGVLERIRPDLVVYNAGSDVLGGDPLSRLALSAKAMAERDLYVVTQVREHGATLAMVLSGGYGKESWLAHARSIERILARFDRQT